MSKLNFTLIDMTCFYNYNVISAKICENLFLLFVEGVLELWQTVEIKSGQIEHSVFPSEPQETNLFTDWVEVNWNPHLTCIISQFTKDKSTKYTINRSRYVDR